MYSLDITPTLEKWKSFVPALYLSFSHKHILYLVILFFVMFSTYCVFKVTSICEQVLSTWWSSVKYIISQVCWNPCKIMKNLTKAKIMHARPSICLLFSLISYSHRSGDVRYFLAVPAGLARAPSLTSGTGERTDATLTKIDGIWSRSAEIKPWIPLLNYTCKSGKPNGKPQGKTQGFV